MKAIALSLLAAVMVLGCANMNGSAEPKKSAAEPGPRARGDGPPDRRMMPPPPMNRPMHGEMRGPHGPMYGHMRGPGPHWRGPMRGPMMMRPGMRHAMMHRRMAQMRRGPMGPGGFGPTTRPSPGEIFDRMDTNKDGSVTRQEFEKFHEQMRERMRGGRAPGPTTRETGKSPGLRPGA